MVRARSASSRLIPLALACLLCVGLSAMPSAPPQGPELAEWPEEVVGTLRSFFERTDVETAMSGLRAPSPAESNGPSELSARLPETPEAPFRYVQRAVRHMPYAGSVLGASGAARAGVGNALDQALLLRALYEARGLRTRLVRGRLRWSDASRLAGTAPDDLTPGDPWVRRVELAADHWWLEVRSGGNWVGLDPAFPDTAWGEARGRSRDTFDEVPASLTARAIVEIAGPSGPLGRAELTVAELVGRPFELRGFVRAPEPPVTPPAASDDPTAPRAQSRATEDEDPLAELLRTREQPHDGLQLIAGGGRLDFPVPDGVRSLTFALELVRPYARPESIVVPFELAPGTAISVLFEAGRVGGQLGAASRPLFDSLQRLVAQENATLEAYEERPRPEDDRQRREPLAEAAPQPEPEPEEAGVEIDDDLHPADSLHLSALRAWETFGRFGPRAIGMALLSAAERVASPVGVDGGALRVAVLRWSPPEAEAPGALAVWTLDPLGIPSSAAAAARSEQVAASFLHSALLGHVLHDVADAPPATAFDLTLRSVGTGERLTWWTEGAALPLPAASAAHELAERDRAEGRMLVGPAAREAASAQLAGWWAIDPSSGVSAGRVVHDGAVVEAAVDLGPPTIRAELGSVLASLPALHRAARWLILAADPDSGALTSLVPRACAATALVGDLLMAGAPERFPAPRFAAFCGAPVGTPQASPAPAPRATAR